jgi:glycosyltransferase involved in cell wall biosynthesis
LYDGSTVAVVASFDEGFGFSVEEALAHNLKVVARDIPVFREREQPNMFFFQNGPENLADAIIQAEAVNWNVETAKTLRTMDDFSLELCNLITSQL